MAPLRLFNLLAISTLAVFTASFGVAPVTAVSANTGHAARSHAGVAKRKRSGTGARKCKPKAPKPSVGTTVPVLQPSAPASEKPVSTPKPSPTDDPKPSTPAPTPNAPSGGNGVAKRGIAWALGNDPAIQYWKSDKVQYLYTWSAYYPSNAKQMGYVPMPMFWGASTQDDFVKMVVNGKDDYADIVLGFNEPDLDSQSGMSAGQAAGLWKQFINPLKDRGYKLITPATTGSSRGDTWMGQFMGACNTCHFDGMAMHYYGTKAQEMIDYITKRYNQYKMPIWITEFSCQDFSGNNNQCDANEAKTFLETILKWADETEWVKAAMPFGVMHDMNNVEYTNQLMASSGKPNSLGQEFLYL